MCVRALFMSSISVTMERRASRGDNLKPSHGLWIARALVLQSLAISLPLAAVPTPGHAQAPAPAPDPAFEAAKRAWDALAETDRRAIQDGLIWTGDYKGVVVGDFGRGTRAAIIAYAQRTGLPTDGTLDQRGRAMLAAAAGMARISVGFSPVRDPKTGAVISLPTKLLPRRVDTPQGSRWAAADNSLVVETMLASPQSGDLPAIFDALKESTPQRKVTYRLLRPDFLVVSGEIGRSIFYTRIARPPADQSGPLRGYTITYPNGAKTLDSVSIAVANGWVPFPPANGAVAVAAPPSAGQPASPPAPTPRPATAPAASGPQLSATGLVVAADKVLTVFARCNDPRIAGRPATVIKRDDESGATLLQVAGLNGRPVALRTGTATAGNAAIVVMLARKGAGNDVDAAVAPGEVLSGAGTAQRKRIFAPVQAEGQGAPVFDRFGGLVGLAGSIGAPRQVAGIVPQRAWPLLEPAVLAGILSAGNITATSADAGQRDERTAGEIAAGVKPSLVPVLCTP